VDVRDDRQRGEADDRRERRRVLVLRDRDANDLASGRGERSDLRRPAEIASLENPYLQG